MKKLVQVICVLISFKINLLEIFDVLENLRFHWSHPSTIQFVSKDTQVLILQRKSIPWCSTILWRKLRCLVVILMVCESHGWHEETVWMANVVTSTKSCRMSSVVWTIPCKSGWLMGCHIKLLGHCLHIQDICGLVLY